MAATYSYADRRLWVLDEIAKTPGNAKAGRLVRIDPFTGVVQEVGTWPRLKHYLLEIARADRVPIVVPSVCIAEWWRGRTDLREKILAAVVVEHTDDALVRLAGEALARLPTATSVDAMVMACAARRGGVVFTSDVTDSTRLQLVFPAVRVLGV